MAATHVPDASSVSASSLDSSPSNIKIEQVLNSSSSSASTDPLSPSQSSTTTASFPLYPPQQPHPPPPPPTPSSLLLPLSTTLHISEPHVAVHNQLSEYRNHKVDILPSSSSSAFPEQSMAAAVAVPQPTHAMQPFTRPIRFVANDGQPHAKRRRISAACKTCRKRKTRCSGEKPACDTCRQNGHSCLGYSDPAPSTPSHSPQQEQKRQKQDNPQVPAKSPSTPAATTPTDQPTVKDHFYLKSPSMSPKDRRIPQGNDPDPQLCDPPNNQHERGKNVPPSRRQSQKRKSIDHQDKNDKENVWNMSDERDEGQSRDNITDKGSSPDLRYRTPPAQRPANRYPHRIPYFRYFGPTAIVPGYKQMVVEVKDQSNWARHASNSISTGSSSTSPTSKFANFGGSPTPTVSSISPESIQFYDPNDPAPNNPLIAHLVKIFFVNVGCNFPFLNRETFTRDVKDKRVDVILVDAVCAVAARFSTNPLLQATPQSGGRKGTWKAQKCEYGTVFANRAKSQVVDTFACPKLSTVQACILLAYVEFGSNRDSGLWMFLGLAIRMAQDLGLHKVEGMRGDAKYRENEEVRIRSRSTSGEGENQCGRMGYEMQGDEELEAKIQERERTDTFWVVFFLDRVISSGTGRPVTIRAEEVEIDFPKEESNSASPPPFPALIRIVHLYGRITDLLNSINDKHKIVNDTYTRLSDMEAELTGIYHRISQNLHFNVNNFRHYSSTDQGSVFLLLHIWFHALIVLLHRPTLLIAFEGRMQTLFPNSRELSISSAKTISDILWFAETIDPRAVNGNPFSSQPIYIAACAFLQERLASSSSNPASRTPSPAPSKVNRLDSFGLAPISIGRNIAEGLVSPVSNNETTAMGCENDLPSDSKNRTNTEGVHKKHALLAQAAHGNYQKCYKALKGLEVYWEGARYILTVLDQKTKGIVDPLLYTKEEMEGAEVPRLTPATLGRFRGITPGDLKDSGPAFVKIEEGAQMPLAGSLHGAGSRIAEPIPSSFGSNLHGEPSQSIELLTATGTSNSPNMHLTWLVTNNDYNYQQNHFVAPSTHQGSMLHDDRNELQSSMHPPSHDNHQHETPTPTVSPTSGCPIAGSTSASDAEMLLGLSASSKEDYGQHQHDNGQGIDVLTMGGYTDGQYQTSGGQGNFEYEMMSENFNLNNISWNLNCLEYMPAPYWPDPSFPTTSE